MKTLISLRASFALAVALLLSVADARAHAVWIELLNGKIIARFAEPSGNYEKSPGFLDSLSGPSAFTVITNAAVMIESPKSTNHFQLVNAATTNVAGVESIFTVRAGRKPHFYARWQPTGAGAGTPMLTFDLVPTGKPGEVRVYFRGQPVGGLKATLRTPDDTEKEIPVDAEGYVRFESKLSGLHLLTIAHHREAIAGSHLGKAYHQTSHNTALSWVQ
ncbi:MAG: hypothetical protein IPK15_23015 [Verrucomicrobia bacterium]|nr:hypothetical protein [Verrucomicrobiota bacterium]